MSTEYLTKSQAIAEITQKTGYGRFVIEKRMERLLEAGKIKLLDDPGDARKQRISRADVQTVIDSLTLG
jgi:hypothetical protein